MRQPALSFLPRFAIFVRRYFRVPQTGLRLLLALALACGAFGLAHPAGRAQAATLTVTTAANSGVGSLRQAVLDALPDDTIVFALPNPTTILLTSQITINKDLTITGPGQTALFLDGGNTTRIFDVTAGTLRLSGMTLQNGLGRGQDAALGTPGSDSGGGGAIRIHSTAGVTVENATFDGNRAQGGAGGNSALTGAGFNAGGGGGAGGGASAVGGFGGGGGGAYSFNAGGGGGYGGGGAGSCGSNGGGSGGGSYGGLPLGGTGGSGVGEAGFSAGGGGAGMGGAILVLSGGALGIRNTTFSDNSAVGGAGGSNTTNFGAGGGGGGAGLGSAIFNNGSLCQQTGVTFSANTTTGGSPGAGHCGFGGGCPSAATAGRAVDTSAGVFDASSNHSCAVYAYRPSDLIFTPAALEENRPAGTAAGSFASVDADAGDSFTYTLVAGSGDGDNARFSISGSNLLTTAILDYEQAATYSVRVRTADSYGLYREESFTISITNVNDDPTALTLTPASLAENQPVGTLAGTFGVVDQDFPPHTYALVTGGAGCTGADNGVFTVSGNQLLTAAVLDFETLSSYNICARVTDSGAPALSFTQAFTITVTDANDAPTGVSLSADHVEENAPTGAAVGQLTASDPDPTQTHIFSLAAGGPSCPGTDNASFAIAGDELQTSTPLDFETRAVYQICLRATDSGTPALSVDWPFTVYVDDANDAPYNLVFTPLSLTENQPSGTAAGSFAVSDPDAAQTHVFSLATGGAGCPGTDNASFSVVGNALRASAPLDFETQPGYEICARAIDSGSPALFVEAPFTITLTDDNEAPTAIHMTGGSLDENQLAGTLAASFTTNDPDAAQTHAYTLVDGGAGCPGTDNAAYTLSGADLLSAAIFDFETQNSYTVCVRSTDSGAPAMSLTQAFTIIINDANEAPTEIHLSANHIIENEAAGTAVGTLSSDDSDAGQTHSYSLVAGGPGCPGTDNGSFAVAGDELQTAIILDYEAQASLNICVRSTDDGSPILGLDRPFTIHVNDANDAPYNLVFTPLPLAENQPSGTAAGSFAVSDPDAAQTHVFSLATGGAGCPGTDNASFSLVGNELTTTGPLDFETQPGYEICARATDSGSPARSIEAPFTISLGDGNDAPTAIYMTGGSLDENQPAGTPAASFTTDDADAAQTHAYTLVDGGAGCPGTDNTAFTFSGADLLSAAIFDFETQNSYTVCVRSTDSGAPAQHIQTAFTITVANANEAPALVTPLADQNGEAATPFAYTIPAGAFSDPDGDALTYTAALASGDPLPAWLSFDAATRALSGTPVRIETLDIRVTAADPGGLSATDTFRLQIAGVAGNRAPVLVQLIPNTIAQAGAAFNFIFAAGTFADPDGDPLIYLATLPAGGALPTWLDFDSATRAFSGAPGAADAGSLTVHVTALDGRGGEAFTDFIIGVDEDVPPSLILPIPDQAAGLGRPWSFTFDAGTFADAYPGDVLSYNASLADGSPLPAWLSFDPAARTFSGMPPAGSPPVLVYLIRVTALDRLENTATDTFSLSPWSYQKNSSLPTGSIVTLAQAAGAGPSAVPAGVIRLNQTMDISISLGPDPVVSLPNGGIPVCFNPGTRESLLAGGNLGRLVIGASHAGGAWTLLPTRKASAGQVCADVNIFSLFEVFLRPAAAPADSDDTTGAVAALPDTGFAPGLITALPAQPAARAYDRLGDTWLEIPALGVWAEITGVPRSDDGWDVSWLHDRAGWLEGTAYPGWSGNSVLTAHVYTADGLPGPFARLGQLRWGDRVILHASGARYVYEVRSLQTSVSPRDLSAIRHEELPWITLITCQGYNPDTGEYRSRSVARAVLVQRGTE